MRMIRTEIRIAIDVKTDTHSESHEDNIVQAKGESDKEFVDRAAIVLEALRHRSR